MGKAEMGVVWGAAVGKVVTVGVDMVGVDKVAAAVAREMAVAEAVARETVAAWEMVVVVAATETAARMTQLCRRW